MISHKCKCCYGRLILRGVATKSNLMVCSVCGSHEVEQCLSNEDMFIYEKDVVSLLTDQHWVYMGMSVFLGD